VSLPTEPHDEDGRAVKLRARSLSVWYGAHEAVSSVSLDVHARRVLAIIGPSGCGKSTFLRALNRMNDMTEGVRTTGEVLLDGHDIYGSEVDPVIVRRLVGMVFQRSNSFPKSIFENVAFGLRIAGVADRHTIEPIVERALRQAALWDEVKDRLGESGLRLSIGQQQRLCIARALAVDPEVLLLDEPCSALDPIATAKIEELMFGLKDQCTMVIVTHNMQQAARVADFTGFFLLGRLIEYNKTDVIFKNPSRKETEDYITGRFG
jgi:phosphate transport system ATP-binding protein